MINAVIFDMDGLLIDTEKHHLKCWRGAAKEMGYEMSLETSLELRSLAAEFAKTLLKEKYGQDFDYEKLHQIKRKLFKERMEIHPVEIKKGAKELLSWLEKQGYKRVVATASSLESAEQNLAKAGIREYFDYVISAHNVVHGKPMPDVYLEACRRIEERPEDCIALEDSPNGAWAAVRAGCQTIMVPDQTPAPEELKDKLLSVKENLLEVKEYLEKNKKKGLF